MAEHDEQHTDQPQDEAAVEAAPKRRKRDVREDGTITEDVPDEVVIEEFTDAGAALDEERKAEQRRRNEVVQPAYDGDLEELKASGVPKQLVDGQDPDAVLIA